MRKVFVCTILVMLLLMMSISAGCDGGKIDWKAIGQSAIRVAIGELMIPAYEKYAGNKEQVIATVKAILEGNEKTAKYVEYVNLDAILGEIYDIINAKWCDVLFWAGYDTDATTELKEPVTWYISILDFPEILEE
ncbi:MAG: hypothetical protein AMJ79_12780 [Phycisphaerae bacterium SM23_30]|nr:MAG: hypothetical protein AMJ79_12780 [Phycisphaerae bacterium SM23_30]